TLIPYGLALVGPLGLEAIDNSGWIVDSIGVLTLGADPVSYAIAYASALAKRPVRAFTVRKEPKTHGTGKLVEGPFRPGDRVVIIEDVITTGGSALKAVASVREAGATVLGVLAVVDREEGGREAIEAAGLTAISLTRAEEILQLMPGA